MTVTVQRGPLVGALLITCCWSLTATAQNQGSTAPQTGQFWVSLGGSLQGDDQDDPGYGLYRDGYRLVLDGRWEQAVHAFEDLQRRYPASTYSDDAAYWSAYSLKHVQPKSAREAYRAFIEHYRQSSYFDDAVADLEELEAYTLQLAGDKASQSAGVSNRAVLAPGLQRLERELQRASRMYHRMGVPMVLRVNENLDPATRVRMEALYAIGETARDEQAFRTLRGVAVANSEPVPLREAALEALVKFPHTETLPVLLSVAREDTNQTMQSYAVDLIAESPVDTSTRINVLIDLYRTLPPSRREQRQAIFYTIADFGNDHAVRFLGDVAQTSPDFEMRREAVYYLGSIGGPSARSLLMKILLQK